MKRSTRLLSVLLAFVLIFSTMFIAASAYDIDDGITTEEAATILLDYVDEMLVESGDVLKVDLSIFGTVTIIDYTSIDNALSSLNKTLKDYKIALPLLGDANSLKNDAIKGVQRSGGDLNVIYALIQFLKDNTSILQKLVDGSLDLGLANSFLGDSLKLDIPGMLNDIIYDELIKGEGKRSDSAYKGYNSDQLLNVAVKDLLADSVDSFKKNPALLDKIDVTKMSVYSILSDYIGIIYNDFLINPLNIDFKKTLAVDLCKADYVDGVVSANANTNQKFYDIINWDYEFTADTYDFAAGNAKYGGVVAQINDLLCCIVETIFSKDIGLVAGGNENIQANLATLVRYILPLCPPDFFYDGFDMDSISAENIADMDFEEMIILILRAVVEGSMDDVVLPDEINSLEALVTVVLRYVAADNGLTFSYDDKIFADVKTLTLLEQSDEKWIDVILTMLVDYGVQELNKSIDVGLPPIKVAEYKSKGWTWADFLDDVADWAIDYAGGVFAAFDGKTGFERGKTDGGGCWNKLNILVNSLLPLQFLNGVKGGTEFVCDLETLVMDSVLGNLLDFNIEGFLDLVEENDDAANILNINISSALLKLVQKIINSILPGAIPDSATVSFTSLTTNANLKAIVANLLTALNNRKVILLDTLLPLVVELMGSDLNVKVTPKLAVAMAAPERKGSDLRIISTFTQADAAAYLGLSANKVASGYLGVNGIVSAGTIIAKKSVADYHGGRLTLDDVNGKDILNAKATCLYTDNANVQGSGYYHFAAAIKNIPTANAKTPIYAIGYVVYKTAGGEKVVYTQANTFTLSA